MVAVTEVVPGLVRRSSAEEPSAVDPPTIQEMASGGVQGAAASPRRSPSALSVVVTPTAPMGFSPFGSTVSIPPVASVREVTGLVNDSPL